MHTPCESRLDQMLTFDWVELDGIGPIEFVLCGGDFKLNMGLVLLRHTLSYV